MTWLPAAFSGFADLPTQGADGSTGAPLADPDGAHDQPPAKVRHAVEQPVDHLPHQDAGAVIEVRDGWARICLRHEWLSGTFHTAGWARKEACIKCHAELEALRGESRFRALRLTWAKG